MRQGGASSLTREHGNKSFALDGTQKYRGLTAAACPDATAGFAMAAGSSARTGAATVLSSPASGPLSLTYSGSASDAVSAELNAAEPEWQEFWDEEVEASYYFNCITREAQWVRPDGF